MRRRRGIMGLNGGAGIPIITATATGNPLTFETDLVRPLKSLVIPFTPIQSGSGDPSPANVRPISGWTGCNIEHRGKNLFNVNREYAPVEPPTSAATTPRTFDMSKYYCGYRNVGTYSNIGNKISINNGVITFLDTGTYLYGAAFPLKLKPEMQYRASFIQSGITGVTVSFYNAEGIYTGWAYAGGGTPISGQRFTVPAGTETVLLVINGNGGATISNFQIEQGTTASSYEPYQGNTLNINWQTEAGTIYGGTLTLNEDGSADIVANKANKIYIGDASESWAKYGSGSASAFAMRCPLPNFINQDQSIIANYLKTIGKNSTWGDNDNWVSWAVSNVLITGIKSITTVDAWKAYLAENPLTIVYDLQSSLSYHLDNVGQLVTFLGTNTIWADTNGTNTATYLKHQS